MFDAIWLDQFYNVLHSNVLIVTYLLQVKWSVITGISMGWTQIWIHLKFRVNVDTIQAKMEKCECVCQLQANPD